MMLNGRAVGAGEPLFLIAGPCVLETADLAMRIADTLADLAARRDLLVIFKGSFDKANRTAASSYRGPGIDEGLRILESVRAATGLPVTTDVHAPDQVPTVAAVVDLLQTPAFLARQTDLIEAVARSGKPATIKKAQFLAPDDMAQVLAKARDAAADAHLSPDRFLLCERGATFGYNNLVTDLRSLAIMARTGAPVVFDATHSVQLPGALGGRSGGQREYVPLLARGAVAAGVAGLFMETHHAPDMALSDGPNAWPLAGLEPLVAQLLEIDAIVKRR